MKSIIYSLVLLCLLNACKERLSFSNQNGTCKLNLYADTTYSFTYPNFLNSKKEKGAYKIYRDSIVLLRKYYGKIDSVDIRYICLQENPDTLLLTFKDLYENDIDVKVIINNTNAVFQTDSKGQISISYAGLVKSNIIKENEKIDEIKIIYENKLYVVDMEPYKDSKKPERLDFTLNQFLGKKYAILKRKYLIKSDTILVNDISRKVIGSDDRLVRSL